MSTNDIDRLLQAWLDAEAPRREPEHLLGSVLARTSRTRRRPAWSIPERWIPMSTFTAAVAPPRMPWRLLAATALLVLALAAALILSSAGRKPLPPPFGVAANGGIIYGVGGDLFIRDTITGPDRPFVEGAASDFAPAFAPDGTRVAFFRMVDGPGDRMELWVGSPDASDVHRLAEFTTMEWFRWAPDGRVIAVTAGDEQAPTLSFVDVATGQVTHPELAFPISQPTWRPLDGSQLAVRARDQDGAWGFSLLDRNGDGLTRLSLDEGFQDDPYYAENVPFYFLDPAWSPDGSTLAFHTLERTVRDDDPGFRVHLATVGADGAVADDRILPTDSAVDDVFEARWLPDGSGLVAHTLDEGIHGLVLHPLDGTAPRDLGLEVRPDRTGDFAFVISPDGREVIGWSTQPVQAWRIALADGSRQDLDLAAEEWPTWQRLAP